MIDIMGQEILEMSEKIINTLLKDQTTGNNICWGTEHYIELGQDYYPQEPITKGLIVGNRQNVIRPRIVKDNEEKAKRTKDKAEVFTPSWICNEQNNLVDEAWFGKKDVFNTVIDRTWKATTERIVFSEDKDWRKYVDARRLEISCGEAPYLVSRYDTVTGCEIPVEERIGLLDRKLRIVNENTVSEEDWFKWFKIAYESTYGFEYQGDSLLIARCNLLFTFIEYMEHRFGHKPTDAQLQAITKIISWNIWQMDGITMTVPYSERPKANVQFTIFDFMDNEETSDKEQIPCLVKDWRANKKLEFRSMVEGE